MLNDLLNNLQRDDAITEVVSLRSFAAILSDPVAFVTSRASSTDWTLLTVIPTYQERLVHWQRFQTKGERRCHVRKLMQSRS